MPLLQSDCFLFPPRILLSTALQETVWENPARQSTPGLTVTFVEDKAVSLELPSSVILTVSDAPEGIRGDSANNVQKPVVMETGITLQAPLFIKTGEKIKVDTRTGKYMERA